MSQGSDYLPSSELQSLRLATPRPQRFTSHVANHYSELPSVEEMDIEDVTESSETEACSTLEPLSGSPTTTSMLQHATVSSTRERFRAYKHLETQRSRLQAALLAGPLHIIDLALEFEQDERDLTSDYINDLAGHMFTIILASEDELLEHHVKGDFVKHYKANSHFRSHVDGLQKSKDRPAIYRVTVADRQGNGHTADELDRVLTAIEQYIAGELPDDAVKLIDSQFAGSSGRALRWITDAYGQRLESQVSLIAQFVANARQRISAYESPFLYVGVTIDIERRRHNHLRRGSNNIISLFLAASKLYYDHFELHFHVLFPCFELAHGIAGEILFERIGCGLLGTGGGFTCVPGGTGGSAMSSILPPRWAQWARDAVRNGPYLTKLAALEKSSPLYQMINRVVREEWRLEKFATQLQEIMDR